MLSLIPSALRPGSVNPTPAPNQNCSLSQYWMVGPKNAFVSRSPRSLYVTLAMRPLIATFGLIQPPTPIDGPATPRSDLSDALSSETWSQPIPRLSSNVMPLCSETGCGRYAG